jgi:hypothetical protein
VRHFISGPLALPAAIGGFNSVVSLNSTAYMTAVLCNAVVLAFFLTMAYLLLVALLRLLVRRLWIADTIGAMLIGTLSWGTFGPSLYQNVGAVAFGAVGGYGYLWLSGDSVC